MTTHLKIADVEQLLREVGYSHLGLQVSRIRDNIIITDGTYQPRSQHKALGMALKNRGLKCNHGRNSKGLPIITIFPTVK